MYIKAVLILCLLTIISFTSCDKEQVNEECREVMLDKFQMESYEGKMEFDDQNYLIEIHYSNRELQYMISNPLQDPYNLRLYDCDMTLHESFCCESLSSATEQKVVGRSL